MSTKREKKPAIGRLGPPTNLRAGGTMQSANAKADAHQLRRAAKIEILEEVRDLDFGDF